MSYGKKDEDADQAIVKVDRTAVFQEGNVHHLPRIITSLMGMDQLACSTTPPYPLGNVASSLQRYRSSFLLEIAFLQMKPRIFFSAYRSCSRTKTPLFAK